MQRYWKYVAFFPREAAQRLSCSVPALATVFQKFLPSKRLNQIFLCAAFQSFLLTTEIIPLLPVGIMHSFDRWVLNMLHSGKKKLNNLLYTMSSQIESSVKGNEGYSPISRLL